MTAGIPDQSKLARLRPETIVGVPAGLLLELLKGTPTLGERQVHYLEVRQHTLSTAGLAPLVQLIAEADYVLGEARELRDAVQEYVGALRLSRREDDPADFAVDELRHVRHELADVVLAAATFAGMLPGRPAVESCIEEKTEADRGRG